MWPYKLARFGLLCMGALGFAEYSRRAGARPDEPGAVDRVAPVLAGGLPPLTGGRIPIPERPPAAPDPSEVVLDVLEAALEPPPAPAASLAPARGSTAAPARQLSPDEVLAWNTGSQLFDREWTEADGLGAPGFNAESCGTCHNAPCIGGAGGNEFNVIRVQGPRGRLASPYATIEEPGNQLTRLRDFRERLGRRGDPRIAFTEIQTPTLLGLGAIDTIPDAEILSREDPDDDDGDGIRGAARRLRVNGLLEVGRFGWKAQTPRLSDFVCLALAGELGLTVPGSGGPATERGFGLALDEDEAEDPELPREAFEALAFFVANLAPPEPGARSDVRDTGAGQELFDSLACSKCHVPTLMGSEGPVHLYSDLLLHELRADPGKEPARTHVGGQDGEPEPNGFRTAPLWGIGETAPYMHDGRAETLREAILAHDGEGAASREGFERLAAADQSALIAFLESL